MTMIIINESSKRKLDIEGKWKAVGEYSFEGRGRYLPGVPGRFLFFLATGGLDPDEGFWIKTFEIDSSVIFSNILLKLRLQSKKQNTQKNQDKLSKNGLYILML